MSTHLAAAGEALDGLCLFGYPLHPPGKPDRPRTAHFPDAHAPLYVLQGTRDALGTASDVEAALASWAGPWSFQPVEGADHERWRDQPCVDPPPFQIHARARFRGRSHATRHEQR